MPTIFRVLYAVLLSIAFSATSFSADRITTNTDGPIFRHAVQTEQNPVFIRVVQTPGPRIFSVAGRHQFEIPGGADVTVDNPETRDGESFCEVGILHEDNEGCFPSCDACHFFFVIAFNIEPGSGSSKTIDEFYDYWHGENGDATITWTESGAGSGSGWGGINNTPNPADSLPTTFSEMRFTVSEYLLCGTSRTIEFTASSSVPGTAPVSVTLTLDCDTCEEWEPN